MSRLLPLLTLAFIAPVARAFVLIDDFTVGGFTHVLTQENSFLKIEAGLDRAHVAFGYRQSFTTINANPNNTTLEIHVGGGEQAFSSPMPVMWFHDLRYGDGQFEVDFSQETEFWADIETAPPGSLADNWDLTVMDANGVDASNGGWLHRPEGIRFRKQAFSRQVDWSRIVSLEFTQNWDSLPNPTEYKVTRFYAVPEPGTLLALGAGLLLAVRRRRRQ